MEETWFLSSSAAYAAFVFMISKKVRTCEFAFVQVMWLMTNSLIAGGYLSVLTRGSFYPVPVDETRSVYGVSIFMVLWLCIGPWWIAARHFVNRQRK
jgi:hypothetical protein